MAEFRIEHDTMGNMRVPAEKYWGAQTQRSFENFRIGREEMPDEIIDAFAVLKKAAASVNADLGKISRDKADLIGIVADEILDGKLDGNFPLVVYQTGSGTQSNMNVNEVIANRGNEIAGKRLLHPNDDVNMSQSSNDTFPTAMHIAAVTVIEDRVLPNLMTLRNTFRLLEDRYMDIVKTGRTHLQDATPLTLGQEISGWRSMLDHDYRMIEGSLNELRELAAGGTAVGTGLNAHPDFAVKVAEEISRITGKEFRTAENKFQSLTSKDALVYSHGALKALAADLLKIANDIRMLASGPRCGIGELKIPENEPGSSIMPGKVNPTQCEAVTMVSVQVMGNDVTIGIAASQGNFELNVFMPVLIYDYLESANLLADVMRSFEKNCVRGIEPNRERIEENMQNSLMLVTALTPHIGYEAAAAIAETAHRDGITLKQAAAKEALISEVDFDEWVDPARMTGIKKD
ncbi:MAG: class II fumarate hydratase [Anaerovoracaceae bacterium]|jgi:fumarate hydratase class II